MKSTRVYKMSMPQYSDPIDVDVLSENFETIDYALEATQIKKTRVSNTISEKCILPYYRIRNNNDFDVTVTDRNFNIDYVIEAGKGKRFDVQTVNTDMNFYVQGLHDVTFEWFIPLQEYLEEGGGGGGTTNYNDLTNKPKINGVELNGNVAFDTLGIKGAAAKDVDTTGTAVTSTSTNVPTSAAVNAFVGSEIAKLGKPMEFKGKFSKAADVPDLSDTKEGWTYKVAVAGTYAGQKAKVGDAFISTGTAWEYFPSGDDEFSGENLLMTEYTKGSAKPESTDVSDEDTLNEAVQKIEWALSGKVDKDTTVNGKKLNANIVLSGSDEKLNATSYSKDTEAKDITKDSKIDEAVAQLEYRVDTKANKTSVLSDWQTTPDDDHIPSEKLVKAELSSLEKIVDELKKKVDKAIVNYGFHINGNESNPSNAITYLGDAIGMIPAKMNYTSGTFDYGSWQNAFFMPKPCMLKSDGTVAYYLNPNDYTKKTDGTASDVANDSFDGNAMMEWGEIWWMVLPDPLDVSSATVYISNTKLGEGYHAWSNIGLDGNHKEHFYTPIYNGSVVGTKLRSLSGKVPCMNKTAEQEITLAKANGDGWYTEVYCDCEIINWLLVLMGKSLDTQTVYGLGNQSGYVDDSSTNYGMVNTGSMNAKGMFWGKNVSSTSDNSGVKVFGMENYWGNQWRRTAGLINDKGTAKVKMCYGTSDGSTTASYNLDGTGYVNANVLPANRYVTKADYSKGMFVPKTTGGSASTYYCDYYYNNTAAIYFLVRGGYCRNGASCGAFCLSLIFAASDSAWYIGAALSFKSL